MCESPQAYGMKPRKARKPHKCLECDRTIGMGDVYHFHHGVWEGRGYSCAVCLRCDQIRDEYVDSMVRDGEDDERPAFGELRECVMATGIEEWKEWFRRDVT